MNYYDQFIYLMIAILSVCAVCKVVLHIHECNVDELHKLTNESQEFSASDETKA